MRGKRARALKTDFLLVWVMLSWCPVPGLEVALGPAAPFFLR